MCRCSTYGKRAAVSAVFGLCALLAYSAAERADAQARFAYEPFDEAASVAPLFAVRAALVDAILRHDVAGVSRLLAPDYNASEGGPQAAMRALRNGPDLFKDLLRSLAFGGGFVDAEKSRFCAPYWYAKNPLNLPYPHSLQPEEGFPYIVVLANVPVYEQRSRRTNVIGHVGFELVRPALDHAPRAAEKLSPDAERLAPIMFNGQVAYVEAAALKYPDDRVAFGCFELRNGQWLLATFDYR